MAAHYKKGKDCDGSKTLASVHTISEQLETSRKFDLNENVAISERISYYRNVATPSGPIRLVSNELENVLFSSFSGVHTLLFSKCAG